VGTPAARELAQASGAGHGEAGDAPSQGPAREEVLSAQPKSANPDKPANSKPNDAKSAPVIELARAVKSEAAEAREANLVTSRPKPEKRKNAKERAKAKFAGNDAKDKDKTAEDGTRPMTATAKSEAEAKAERKAETKVAAKAAKAERKKNRSAGKRAAAKAA
jgi:hypothetical protein